jgi:hypothetical protein
LVWEHYEAFWNLANVIRNDALGLPGIEQNLSMMVMLASEGALLGHQRLERFFPDRIAFVAFFLVHAFFAIFFIGCIWSSTANSTEIVQWFSAKTAKEEKTNRTARGAVIGYIIGVLLALLIGGSWRVVETAGGDFFQKFFGVLNGWTLPLGGLAGALTGGVLTSLRLKKPGSRGKSAK